MKNKVIQFINSQARHKLIVTTRPVGNINTIDVGKLFSERLNNIIEEKRFSLKAKMDLDKLFKSKVIISDEIGKYLAIKNIGILLESKLNIDFVQLLEKHSKDNALFIQWDGEIENKNLYFLTKEKGQKINIKNLSHIII